MNIKRNNITYKKESKNIINKKIINANKKGLGNKKNQSNNNTNIKKIKQVYRIRKLKSKIILL